MTPREPLVLYVEAYWVSPWVCAVHVALREKGLPFATAVTMMRHGVGAIDQMHARSLTGTAPVLQHGGFLVAESLAIVEYLEEVFPEPRVLPADVRDRARARQLMTWMRNDHQALRRERPSERILYPRPAPAPLSPEAQRVADDLVRVAVRLGADARGALFGDRFGVVDVELAFALMRLTTSGAAVPAAIQAYVDAVRARPSVREFLDHSRPPNPPD
ncbi:MAG: glutathione transferase [Deltaproteobacteria bacterium]|nr:glutathione transferase [Deltaproteobacteria bacterium]